ncbi:RNA export factor gle2 [Elasticomyces elasticus]|nr:RNA export factor gle2 [Elasticomyces elasticus]
MPLYGYMGYVPNTASSTDTSMAGIFGSATASNAAAQSTTQGDITNDRQLSDPPDDSISAVKFSPNANFLALSSWNKQMSIYQIMDDGSSAGKARYEFNGPVLSTQWSKDGTKLFGGAADNTARMVDLAANITSGPGTTVGGHDQPIRCIETMEHNGSPMLITGSWDKTIKYWDLRQQTPAATVQCKDRVYSMSLRKQLLAVACADRWIEMINLNDPGKSARTIQSPLKWQTRVVSCFQGGQTGDGEGFAIGSIEGRCAIQYVDDKQSSNNFSFKCHRQNIQNQRDAANVYPVNAISFHPEHGTFSTAGSDGTFHFWDKDAKHRLKGYPEVGGTISATDFNHTGTIFAYAVTYDWSKGYAHNTPQYPNKVMLHPIQPDECKPRPTNKKR